MNRYIVAIHRTDDEDPLLFLVFADDTREYVNQVIIEAQKEFHFFRLLWSYGLCMRYLWF